MNTETQGPTFIPISQLPLHFMTPQFVVAGGRRYAALPKRLVRHQPKDTMQVMMVTRYQLHHCDENGREIIRVRRSKKERRSLRALHRAALAQ